MYARTRGYLPHIVQQRVIYFVTFRLADSLPASVLLETKEQFCFGTERTPRDVISHRSAKMTNYQYQEAVQKYLDTSHGQYWLKRPEIASIVHDTIKHFNNQRYELFTWRIMPKSCSCASEIAGGFFVEFHHSQLEKF